jgi:NAD(P)-dependent dehydrogenase (short-subunit alcohol dehydrogenase family)
VVVAGRRDGAGQALVEELRSFGSEAEFLNADVRKDDDVRVLVEKTVARFAGLTPPSMPQAPKGSLDRFPNCNLQHGFDG